MGKKVDIGYDIRDLFTTSYAESKVNMYQKLVKELPDNIADIDEKLIYMNSYIDLNYSQQHKIIFFCYKLLLET